MVPASLPELPKPSRTSGESRKSVIQNANLCINIRNNPLYSLLIPLKSHISFFNRLPFLTRRKRQPTLESIRPQLGTMKLDCGDVKTCFFLWASWSSSTLSELQKPTRTLESASKSWSLSTCIKCIRQMKTLMSQYVRHILETQMFAAGNHTQFGVEKLKLQSNIRNPSPRSGNNETMQ